MLIDSFNCCGITSRNKLHSALDQILREMKVINDYVTDFSECSSYDIFEPESDPTIEDAEERLPNEKSPKKARRLKKPGPRANTRNFTIINSTR